MCADPCSECDGYFSVNVPVGHRWFGRMFICDNSARKAENDMLRAARLQAMCGLNDAERVYRLDDAILTGGVTDQIAQAARDFVSSPSGFLTMHGGTGNGKTLMCIAIVNECVARSVPAMYTTLFNLEQWVRAAYSKRGEQDGCGDDMERINRLSSVRVLVVDEFDKVKVSDWSYQIETAVVDNRYRDAMAGLTGTVFAMNDLNLSQHIESRLSDRRFKLFCNTDPDMRR
jgi:DNA replication protein DnaC